MYHATIKYDRDPREAYVTDSETGVTLVLHEDASGLAPWRWLPHHAIIDGTTRGLPPCFLPRPEIYTAIEAAHERTAA